ncbi:MAG TPA: LytTR family DNA-binding domain-containing protein [Chitinophagaceae bacterium]|nr:LytTR family DNA-binding domain-containing protein [Chitinophagaceae bacterium]
MDSVKVLIVDDEPQSRSLIRKLLSLHFPQMIIEEAENVSSAINKIHQTNFTLVFLDVQMRAETGFDLLDKIGAEDIGVIFTTAHSEFALKAFRYSALDYLMKPIDSEEFKTSVERALLTLHNRTTYLQQLQLLKELKSTNKLPSKLTVPTTEGFLFIVINDILYCRAVGNYTEFVLCDHQKILSSYTLGYYAELLQPHHFFRVHRSYLINLSYVKMYKKGTGGSVLMSNGDEIEVSRNSKEEFLKVLRL